MDLQLNPKEKKEHLYLEVYHYYKKLIVNKKLLPGSKMPSLRKCAQELKLSRTTIESAYLQLAADGFIISKAQSGYYVTDIAEHQEEKFRVPLLPPVLTEKASVSTCGGAISKVHSVRTTVFSPTVNLRGKPISVKFLQNISVYAEMFYVRQMIS